MFVSMHCLCKGLVQQIHRYMQKVKWTAMKEYIEQYQKNRINRNKLNH